MIGMKRDAKLLQVVGALDSSSGLASRLNRGKEQSDENRDDRDDDQKLDQRETTPNGLALGGKKGRAFQCLILE